MTLDEFEERIWNGLQELGRYMRIVRDIMQKRENICGALHRYDIFFSSLYWAINNFLVVRICRITDESNPNGITFGRWLKKVSQEKCEEIDIQEMRRVRKDYQALLKSNKYLRVNRLRDEEYVHDDYVTVHSEDVKESDPTWKDLFEIIEELQSLRNRAAIAGACTPSMWTNDMDEPELHHLLKVLEKECHDNDTHKKITNKE